MEQPTDPSRLTPHDSLGRSECAEEWITVLEFAPADTDGQLLVRHLEFLIANLSEWRPAALLSPDRYAIQLHIPARSSHQAFQWAMAYHRGAARAAGLPPIVFVRGEILTVGEFERPWAECDPSTPSAMAVTTSPTAPAATAAAAQSVLCNELYTATRALLAARTAAEVSDIVVGFVTAIGGRVEPGAPGSLPEMIEIDLATKCEKACHASARAFSVAGLVIEQALPDLLADAGQALVRVRAVRGRSGPGPVTSTGGSATS